MKLIDKKKFAKTALNKNFEAFVVHITLLISKMTIYLGKKAQIALLIAKQVTIPVK